MVKFVREIVLAFVDFAINADPHYVSARGAK